MEYLVTMTTHVPDGTPDQADADVRACEAAHSSELAMPGHLLGLWRARDPAEMQAILKSLRLDAWMTVETTPLTPHPSDPVLAS